MQTINDNERAKNYKKFQYRFDVSISQQARAVGDCGVWVCKFMQQCINGERPHTEVDMERSALEFGHEMAKILYALAKVC